MVCSSNRRDIPRHFIQLLVNLRKQKAMSSSSLKFYVQFCFKASDDAMPMNHFSSYRESSLSKKKAQMFGDSGLSLWIAIHVNQTFTVASIDQAVLRCVTWNTDGGRLMVEGLNGQVQGRPFAAYWAGQVPEVSEADKNSHGLS